MTAGLEAASLVRTVTNSPVAGPPRSAADEDGRAVDVSTGVGCDHRQVDNEQARVLARDGNAAVVHLQDRAFPGIHVQGDTFAELQRQHADAAGRLRRAAGGGEALDDLEYAVAEMAQMLRFYETVLAEHGILRPYRRDETG